MQRWLELFRARVPASARARLLSLAFAIPTGAVLAIAAWLEPSPLGHSTHTQLGLNQCSFLTLTGYPCPMCGATTSFTLMAHLRPLDALQNQPFAVLLFLMTLAVFGISVAELLQPRGRWGRLLGRIEPWEGVLAASFLIAMGLGWIYKAVLMVYLSGP